MGVGGKRVAGVGSFGELVGNREGLTAGGGEVAGRACPAPTGWRQYKRPGRDELFPYGSR